MYKSRSFAAVKSSSSQDSSLLFLLAHSFIQNLFIEKVCVLDQGLTTEVEKDETDKIPSSLKLSLPTKAKIHSCVLGLNVPM